MAMGALQIYSSPSTEQTTPKGWRNLTKPELGTKRDCPECGARFYDLHKEPAHCPKCHHDFIPEALLKPRKTRAEEEKVVKTDDEDDAEETTEVKSLDEADAEKRAPESKRKTALDEDDDDDDDDSDDGEDIPDIEDIAVDLDDDDDEESNDSILVDDSDDDVASIIKPTSDDD